MRQLLKICEAGRIPFQHFSKGEAIIEEGQVSEKLAILKSGRVSISREGNELSVINEAGSVFGEISILVGGAHMATVMAEEDTEVYVVENGDQWVQHCPNLLPNLAFIIASRLKALTFYVSEIERGLSERDERIKLLTHALGGNIPSA